MPSKLRPRVTFANVTSLTALFVALAGGAYAVTQPPPNSVGTAQLKADAVTSPKIKDHTIVGADINKAMLGKVPLAQHAVTAGNAAKLGGLDPNQYLRSNGKAVDAAHADSAANADQLDNLDSSAFLQTTSAAGGSLTGPFSNLQLRVSSVGSANVADNALTGTDIDENSLRGLNPASTAKVGNPSGLQAACDPNTSSFVTCASTTVSTPRPGKLLVLGSVTWDTNAGGAAGSCRIVLGGVNVAIVEMGETSHTTNRLSPHETTLMALPDVTAAQAHVTPTLNCNEAEADIAYPRAQIIAVLLD